MPLESEFTEEQLFDQLISSIVHSAWVALGKIKNPMTDKVDRDLRQASTSIDMLDMLFKRMSGNLSDREDQYLGHLLSELKMNYIEEKKKDENAAEEPVEEKKPADKPDEDKKKTAKKAKKPTTTAKKTAKKAKGKK
jgi:hypothetical protein